MAEVAYKVTGRRLGIRISVCHFGSHDIASDVPYKRSWLEQRCELAMIFVTDVKMAANGRMVLPHAVREAMGVTGETRIIVTVEGTEVRLSPIASVVTKLQALYREHVKHDADTDAFLDERRSDDRADGDAKA